MLFAPATIPAGPPAVAGGEIVAKLTLEDWEEFCGIFVMTAVPVS